MENEVFQRFREIIYKKSGIALSPDKKSMLKGRIKNLLRQRQLTDEIEYLEIIETDSSGEELIQLIEAISTNTTYFWREHEHFNALGEILDGWKATRRNHMKIWCAAASSGQEPYTIAMKVREHMPESDIKILATDINTRVLNYALEGIYPAEDIKKLPPDKQSRFFSPLNPEDRADEALYQVDPALTNMILFKKLNLISFPYPLKGPIDIIFCRNVMIYFDLATRQAIINELCRLLAPGGYLFLSLSESLLGIEHPLLKYKPSIFRKDG